MPRSPADALPLPVALPSSASTEPPKPDTWFEQEVRPLEPGLRAWMARRHPGLRPELDDIVQESYWRLLRARSSGTIRNARTYLFGIAQNIANQIHRSHRRHPSVPINEIPESATISEGDIVDTIAHQQDLALAADAIKALPDRCREIVTLYSVEGLSYREIAQRLNIAEETVRVQMARAIKKCVTRLRASDDILK